MDYLEQLQNKVADLTSDLLKEGILDDQFKQLQRLQDRSMPGFVNEMVSLYLDESEKIIDDIRSVLKHTEDYEKVDANAMQLKGSSVSIGAKRITDTCNKILRCCKENNHEGCVKAYNQLKQEHSLLKIKVEPLLSMEREIAALDESTKSL